MRALIVDDSRVLRHRFMQILSPLGWKFAEAETGVEALATLTDSPPFDLMLLDINMPLLGGMDCLRHLRSHHLADAMKVMMVSTEADAGRMTTALELGADEFLMKPVHPESMQAKLLLLGFDPAPPAPAVVA